MRSMMNALCALFVIMALGAVAQGHSSVPETPDPGSNMPTSNESSQPEQAPPPPPTSEDAIEVIGTVVYKDIEGGFFAIDADDGSKYDPINLPESFKKDGMRVKVSVRLEKDLMSFHMYGVLVEVLEIEAL